MTQKKSQMAGALYIVATPIGNLEDISARALKTLETVDLIAAEDTRHSKPLLMHYNITTPMLSLHDFNEVKRSSVLLEKLAQGKNVALISDAGTPLINDPGYHLVNVVRAEGYRVIPIPGACAAITALCAAGLPTDNFIFLGFLPHKNKAAREELEILCSETRTLIFYEAPHRLLNTIDNMAEIFGEERIAVIAKELTKMFETIYSASLGDLKKWLIADANRQRGEFVILVHGAAIKTAEQETISISPEAQKTLKILLDELPPKQAAKLAAKITGINVKKLYKIAIT